MFYLIIINFITFISYGMDKLLAIRHMTRISEYRLLILGIVGGCFGALLGMILFHHKIRKRYFWIINITMCIFIIYIFYYGGKL